MTDLEMVRAMLERAGDKIEFSGWMDGTAIIEDFTREIDFWFFNGNLTYMKKLVEKY